MMPLRSLLLNADDEIHPPRDDRPRAVAGPVSVSGPGSGLSCLPVELRLKIWSCAAEPRIVILDDLFEKAGSYPIPPVTQLNAEARYETRDGYEPVGHGSHFHFSKDILVCDPQISYQGSNPPLEELAPHVQKLAFWDCFPDDGCVDGPTPYRAYLAKSSPPEHFGKVDFDKLWFPNLKDLWIVKIGEIHRSWGISVDSRLPYDVRLRRSARQFRYWVDQNIVEIAPLDLDEPETRAVLQRGRCGKEDCRTLNHGRSKMVSKIIFMDGRYRKTDESEGWQRILPWSTKLVQATETDTLENRMRWKIVERILTFSLRWEWSDEDDQEAPTPRRKALRGSGGRRVMQPTASEA